jgi:hypothetical protein
VGRSVRTTGFAVERSGDPELQGGPNRLAINELRRHNSSPIVRGLAHSACPFRPSTGTSGRSPPWWRSSNGDGAVQLTDRLGNRRVLFTGRLARSGIARFGPATPKRATVRASQRPPVSVPKLAHAGQHCWMRSISQGSWGQTVIVEPLVLAMDADAEDFADFGRKYGYAGLGGRFWCGERESRPC